MIGFFFFFGKKLVFILDFNVRGVFLTNAYETNKNNEKYEHFIINLNNNFLIFHVAPHSNIMSLPSKCPKFLTLVKKVV